MKRWVTAGLSTVRNAIKEDRAEKWWFLYNHPPEEIFSCCLYFVGELFLLLLGSRRPFPILALHSSYKITFPLMFGNLAAGILLSFCDQLLNKPWVAGI